MLAKTVAYNSQNYACTLGSSLATDYIVHSLDDGHCRCAASLDFCKSFDSLDLVILLILTLKVVQRLFVR